MMELLPVAQKTPVLSSLWPEWLRHETASLYSLPAQDLRAEERALFEDGEVGSISHLGRILAGRAAHEGEAGEGDHAVYERPAGAQRVVEVLPHGQAEVQAARKHRHHLGKAGSTFTYFWGGAQHTTRLSSLARAVFSKCQYKLAAARAWRIGSEHASTWRRRCGAGLAQRAAGWERTLAPRASISETTPE